MKSNHIVVLKNEIFLPGKLRRTRGDAVLKDPFTAAIVLQDPDR
jgi:hypothetical protein